MALDYSKLSDQELEAIANDDYSKLSDTTLQALASESTPTDASINMAPQAVSAAAKLGGPATDVIKTAYNIGKGSVMDAVKMGDILINKTTPAGVADLAGKFLSSPVQTTRDVVSAYVGGHPYAGQIANTTAGQAVKQGAGFLGRVGSGIVQGALAPESLFALPYQMAAYEQEKIRANPNAPGLEYNPYAQVVRGEYPTQGAAGAANRRATMNRPNTGYVPSAQEAENIMASGDQRMINMYGGKDRLAELMRQKAAERVLGPVAPR